MYWQEKYETMDRESLQQLQLARLKEMMTRLYNTDVPYYKK